MKDRPRIVPCRSNEQIEAVQRLFSEYNDYLGVDLSFQGFEKELADLPGAYAPPSGELLLAEGPAGAAGCVGLRRLEDGICEMKRLYVRPAYRGRGLGRDLALCIIERGAQIGYRKMRLDTLDKLSEAVSLYEALGFFKITPYYPNPLPDVTYWELDLQQAPRRHPRGK